MFCSRQSNNLIKKLQERALKTINDDQKSNFQDWISKYKEHTIHQRNLQTLLIEINKTINSIAPPIIFRENVHNIWNFQIISNSKKKTGRYDIETESHRPRFWSANLPQEYKSQTSLHVFKAKQRKWRAEFFPCWFNTYYIYHAL